MLMNSMSPVNRSEFVPPRVNILPETSTAFGLDEREILSIRNLRGRGSLRHPSRKVIVHHSRGNSLSLLKLSTLERQHRELEGGRSRARAISEYGNAASHTRRVSEGQRCWARLGLSTLKSRISIAKYLTCVVVETCSTRSADDMQIESLLVVLLSKKAPLIIERNTAPGPNLDTSIVQFFLIDTCCILYTTHVRSLKRSCHYVTKI